MLLLQLFSELTRSVDTRLQPVEQLHHSYFKGGGDHIVGRLVDIGGFNRVDDIVAPRLFSKQLKRPVGNDLIDVHVDACPCTSLDRRNDEVQVVLACADLSCSSDHGIEDGH